MTEQPGQVGGRFFGGREIALSCLLVLITTAAFWPVINAGFVNLDDPGYVSHNRQIRSGLNWGTIQWSFAGVHECNWHPVTWLSHGLDCSLYGIEPRGHHVTNLALHVANTLLLFLLLKALTGLAWPSAVVAALFGVHPLHVESVAWISERKDVLSTLFFLLTLLAYTRYARDKERSRWNFYAVALIGFALGLMSKPMLVTLPFVLLLLDYWPLARVEIPNRSGWTRLVWEKLPFFGLSFASCFITYAVQNTGGAVVTLEAAPFPARVANALVAYVRYLGKFFWPADLAVSYPAEFHWPLWIVLGSALLLLAVTLAVVLQARTRSYLAVGWFVFVGTLVPVIGLVTVGGQSMADRYMYIPSIGLLVAVVWGCRALLSGSRAGRMVFAVVAGVVVTCCGIATYRQAGYWRNSEALFARTIAVTKRPNLITELNYAIALSSAGKAEAAIPHFNAALRLDPRGVHRREVASAYADALVKMGQFQEAIGRYQEALEQSPDFVHAISGLGVALAQTGRMREAAAQFAEGVRLRPEDADLRCNLGRALLNLGQLDEAESQLRMALQLQPDLEDARTLLNDLVTRRKSPISQP